MTDRSVTDDATIGHGCHSRSVTDDANARSRMTDEHSALNPENEHREPNTPSASRRRGPVNGDVDGVGDEAPPVSEDHRSGETEQAKTVQDNEQDAVEPWPVDMTDKFMSYYPKGGDLRKVSEALDQIRREGRTGYRDILRGAQNYGRDNKGTETRYLKAPENFLTGRLYMGHQKDNRPKLRMGGAI